ncbi:hypothetical protein [Pantoea ananatis]|uniref:hypothetical protein n=1 Tax=Pantoea ananas TaxID=553 RepID=UPI000AF7C021|nr:hypothetical protein [Pantoea ananatis]
MERSLSAENARLRALLDTQQRSLEQMAEYNRLLSQRVAAYASEISRLKALVEKLQRAGLRRVGTAGAHQQRL